jgi:hypothetical protein
MIIVKRLVSTATIPLSFLCLLATGTNILDRHPKLLVSPGEDATTTDEYIVVFRKDQGQMRGSAFDIPSFAASAPDKVQVKLVYEKVFSGFSAKLSDEALEQVLEDSRVASVELVRGERSLFRYLLLHSSNLVYGEFILYHRGYCGDSGRGHVGP